MDGCIDRKSAASDRADGLSCCASASAAHEEPHPGAAAETAGAAAGAIDDEATGTLRLTSGFDSSTMSAAGSAFVPLVAHEPIVNSCKYDTAATPWQRCFGRSCSVTKLHHFSLASHLAVWPKHLAPPGLVLVACARAFDSHGLPRQGHNVSIHPKKWKHSVSCQRRPALRWFWTTLHL